MTAPRPISLTADDGTRLSGQVWPGGTEWIMLIHDAGEYEDLDRWRSLIPSLLDQGMTVMAFDLRGHGASGGAWAPVLGASDVVRAIMHARRQEATFIALMAPGLSAHDILRAAAMIAVDALILLSPAATTESTSDLRGTGEAKLFVTGAADGAHRQATDRLQSASIGWALSVSFPTRDQGIDLLTGDWASHLGEQVKHFLAECRVLAANARDPVPSERAPQPEPVLSNNEREEQ